MSEQPAPDHGLPRPTVWPAVLAAGIAMLAAGLVTSLIFTAVGALVFALGLGGWIQELRHGG